MTAPKVEMRIRKFTVILAAVILLPSMSFCAGVPDEPNGAPAVGEVMDLKRCLEVARGRQPLIRAAKGQAAVGQGRLGQAKGGYYPAVDLTAGYDLNGSDTTTSGSAGADDSYSASVTLSQNIYDFGRTSSLVRIRELDADALRADLQDTLSLTGFNTKQAYYGLLQAKRNAEAAREVIKQSERQLERAKGFFEVGLRPKFDVTRAEVDLSNAKVALIRAQNAVRLSLARLKNAMGVPEAPDFDIKDDLDVRRIEMTLDEATDKAMKNRADLRASSVRRKAVEESVTLAERGYYPFISGNAGYTWADGSERNDGWNAGIALTVPLFSGFITKHRVQESKANLSVMDASTDIVRQNIQFEVQQAYYNLTEAGERIPAAQLVLRQAEENLEIASGRYATGVGSPIEVTDATVVFVNAKTAYIQALTDYNTAAASLERAIGDTDEEKD